MRAPLVRARAAAFAFFLTTSSLTAATAFAQHEGDRTQARDLAEGAYAAMSAGNYTKAEDLFRRADALYHAPTILLGLARAESHLGKFVEAWEDYHRIILEGAPPAAPAAIRAAVDSAKKEIASVESRRAKATISVTGPTDPTVTLDGAPLAAAALGVERIVNPGQHAVHASAAGWKDGDVTFTVAEGGSAQPVVTLEKASDASGQAQAVPPAPPPTAGPAPPADRTPAPEAPAQGSGSPWRTVGWVATGVGGAGLVLGAVTGGLAIGKHGSAAQSPCDSGPCTQGQANSYQSNVSDFHTFGTVSTVGFIAGGVLAAGGLVLVLTSHGGPSREAAAATFVPYVGAGDVGVIGRF